MVKTDLCKILDIEYPIIQGGMAWVATSELAAAVSNAGGLGVIAAGNAPGEIVEKEIIKTKNLTKKNFAVNVMLLSPYVDEIMEIIYRHRIPVVTTGAGNPGRYVEKLKEINTKILPVVPTVALARRVERMGADAVIVEGTEAGGHIGELTTFALVPQVVDAVKIPVVAAGGIADGRGLLAALSLGARGIQMGTRFVCSEECAVHEDYKSMILRAKDRDAIVTARSTGHPVRVLKNNFTQELTELEKRGISKEEINELGTGKLRAAVVDGDIKNGSVMAGQIAGMIKDIKTCDDIIQDIINGANAELIKLKACFKGV